MGVRWERQFLYGRTWSGHLLIFLAYVYAGCSSLQWRDFTLLRTPELTKATRRIMVCFFMLHCITVKHRSFWQSLLHLFVKWQYLSCCLCSYRMIRCWGSFCASIYDTGESWQVNACNLLWSVAVCIRSFELGHSKNCLFYLLAVYQGVYYN
jgi:hypothetical protein